MDVRQGLAVALKSLRADKKRSLQAMLAFVVGVAALVSICVFGQMLTKQLHSYAEAYSSNTFYFCMARKEYSTISFTPDDFLKFVDSRPDLISKISPCFGTNDWQTKYGDKVFERFYPLGVNENFIDIFTVMEIEQGRWFTHMDIERKQNVCVVGSYAVDEMMNGNALGETLRINGENYTVIGVLKEIDKYKYEDDYNCKIYIPYTKTPEFYQTNCWNEYTAGYIANYYVKATSEENIAESVKVITTMLNERLGSDTAATFQTFNQMFNESASTVISTFMPFLVGGLIIVMLGCVGIMNMMIATVGERTKEIGIRKAFGATCKEIRRQFMLESVYISVLGSLAGILMGTVLSLFLLHSNEKINAVRGRSVVATIPLYFDWVEVVEVCLWVLLPALIFAVLVGVVSGAYPANLAAKMEPVAAINSD